jgi:hypothetical protein
MVTSFWGIAGFQGIELLSDAYRFNSQYFSYVILLLLNESMPRFRRKYKYLPGQSTWAIPVRKPLHFSDLWKQIGKPGHETHASPQILPWFRPSDFVSFIYLQKGQIDVQYDADKKSLAYGRMPYNQSLVIPESGFSRNGPGTFKHVWKIKIILIEVQFHSEREEPLVADRDPCTLLSTSPCRQGQREEVILSSRSRGHIGDITSFT